MDKFADLRASQHRKKYGKLHQPKHRVRQHEESKRVPFKADKFDPYKIPEESKYAGGVDEAIQLIEINDKGVWKMNPVAMEIVKGIKTKVGVISVVGPYRTGKSFLLNRLLGQQDGFEIGPTVQSCTRGIWIWGKPVKVSEDLHVILMDTEGLGSCNRTMNIDIKIFTLSVLLSSMFVYNWLNAIDENALEVLSLVVNLTKYISSQKKNDETGVYNQANYSPYFMWVVRDFSLQMMNSEELEKAGHDPATYWDKLENQEDAAKEYLEKSLEGINLGTVNEENKRTVDKKNEIRKAIKNFFHQREATWLFRPVNEEEKLRIVNKIPYEDLRKPFRKQVEHLIKKIYHNVKPKSINGQTLTGKMFAQMVEEYTTCMNTNGMPEINTAWDRVMDTEIKRVLQESTNKITYELQEIVVNRIPMTPKQLISIERGVRRKAFKLLHDPNIKNAPRDKIFKLQDDFTNNLDEIFEGLFKENELKSKNQAKDLLPRMYQKIKDKIQEGEFENIQDFNDIFIKMAISYLNNTKEPENYIVLHNFLTNHVLEDMDEIMQIQTQKYESMNHEYENKIETKDKQLEHLSEQVDKEKRK